MLAETLRTKDIEAVYLEEPHGIFSPESGNNHGVLNRGFEYPGIGFVVVSGKELFGQEKKQEGINPPREENKRIYRFERG